MTDIGFESDRKSKRGRKAQPVAMTLLDHAVGIVRMVNKRDLTIPVDDYQRDESTGVLAKNIALNFNPVACGVLTVIERSENGKKLLVVADGGTRLSAARMRSDIHELECKVWSGLTSEEEADVFLVINEMRKKLGVEQLQHSEVFAGRPNALVVEGYLQRFQSERISFNALGALRAYVKRFPHETKIVIELLSICATGYRIGRRVFKGMVMLERVMQKQKRTLVESKRIGKLKEKFGTLDSTVDIALGSQNIKGSDPMICARAIAAAIGVKFPKETAP